MTISFVDPVAIDDLAYEIEQRLSFKAGIDPPPRRGYVPRGIYATDTDEYI